MTEIKGGSDLGAAIETVARPAGSHWLLTGDKYFASNAGAELAVVAARPEGAPRNVRGVGAVSCASAARGRPAQLLHSPNQGQNRNPFCAHWRNRVARQRSLAPGPTGGGNLTHS
jgi:alkylation response protein AidB-like acyl-CoA dehydrogenase